MNSESQFAVVMARLKEAVGVDSYSALGRLLGLSSSAYANRKKSGSIPYDEVIALARSRGVSMEWLLFGEGEALKGGGFTSQVTEINRQLLVRIVVSLLKAMKLEGSQGDAVEMGMVTGLAALIYNKVANLESETEIVRTLTREVAMTAEVHAVIGSSNPKAS